MKLYASGMSWGASPRWHDDALWVSDPHASRLWSDCGGVWRASEVRSPSNGLWFLPDGRLVGAMAHEQRIGLWSGSQWEPFADLAPLGVGLLAGLTGDAAGNLYVGDMTPGAGQVILVRSDGTTEIAAKDVASAAGLAIVDDGHTLVVAQTSEQVLTAFTIGTDGLLGERRQWADLAALAGPDAQPGGIWPTEEGIWVATTTGRSLALLREHALVELVDVAPRFPIACCRRESDGALIATLANTDGVPLTEAVEAHTVATCAATLEREP